MDPTYAIEAYLEHFIKHRKGLYFKLFPDKILCCGVEK
jgi:hypothetical protein